jgi:hypothetical protein
MNVFGQGAAQFAAGARHFAVRDRIDAQRTL